MHRGKPQLAAAAPTELEGNMAINPNNAGALKAPVIGTGRAPKAPKEKRGGIFRREHRVALLGEPDPAEVAHQVLSLSHRCRPALAFAEQLEIGPQCRAQEAHPTDDDPSVAEHTDASAGREPLELGSDAIQASAIELVIARNIEHGLVEVPGPGHSLAWTGDISGQDDDVGIVFGPAEPANVQMEVRDDVELQCKQASSVEYGGTEVAYCNVIGRG